MFTGTYTAIVTPFKDGKLDEPALERLIKTQIKGGVDGIAPVGTTGESPTVDYQEHIQIIKLAAKFAAGKIQVLAGTGANSTSEAIYLTEEAEKAGADGSLQVAPYYNKPTQEGLFQHFREVARHTRLPIVLYSIPGPMRHRNRGRDGQAPESGVQECRRHQRGRRQCRSRQPTARRAWPPL